MIVSSTRFGTYLPRGICLSLLHLAWGMSGLVRNFFHELRLATLSALGVQGDGVDVVIVDDFLDGHDGLLGKCFVLKYCREMVS